MRIDPWNPPPNPAPATMPPANSTTVELNEIATNVMPTPTISASMPASINARGWELRNSNTVTAADPASADSERPASTNESEPERIRTSVGPSEP